MGFAEILTIVFVAAKLMNVIDWQWWQVLLPEIIAIVIYVLIFLVAVVASIKLNK